MIWSKEETLTSSEMRDLQLKRLKEQASYVYDHVPYYRNKMDIAGVRPSHISKIEDISMLPLTDKSMLRDNYPFGLFAVDRKEIVRLHASSGTTGKPIVVGYTRRDMEDWTDCCARLACAAGVAEGDTAQICFGYGMFTGGFGLHYGLERVGASVIPASSGNSERQLMYMQDFGTTVIVATPSYALYLSEYLNEKGVDPRSLSLRVGLFGGEGHTPEMRREIERRWNILDTQNYGLTEITGPGVSYECTELCGMHINEDLFYPEIIDPDSQEVLPEGAEGELVITTLRKQGIPIIRYRTKDITSLVRDKCSCGRTNVRMNMVRGRTDDMLIIRGVNVFPSQIESVLVGITGIGPHYQIVVTREKFMDKIEIKVELVDGALLDKYSELERLTDKIRHQMKIQLQLESKITLLNPKELERTTGKSKRVLDLRK
ncbi:phenylacetate--CoA ligase family protein [Candidatus Nomurabacteria bacterium]|nr:phenylacetate--CoA ligase family protein [Candidatus Nomurabacteria bacterium]